MHRIFSRTPRDRISVMPGRRDMYAPIGGDDGAPEGGVQLSSVRAGGQSGKSMPAVEVQLPFHAGGNGGELLGGAPRLQLEHHQPNERDDAR